MANEIRPATKDDVPMLAEVVLQAARSHVDTSVFDLAIPSSEQQRLVAVRAMLTSEQRSFCHYENFLVMCVDGEPAAALSGYAAYDESLLPVEQCMITGFRAVGMNEEQVGGAFASMMPFLECTSDDEPGAWIIEWVACLETFRRRGLVRELMHAILERGKERGHSLCQIGILTGNISAQRAYENVGFVFEYEKSNSTFEADYGCAGLTRLLRRG